MTMLVALYALSVCRSGDRIQRATVRGNGRGPLRGRFHGSRIRKLLAAKESIVEIRTKRDSRYGNFLTTDPHERWGGKHHKLTRGYAIQCAA